MCAVASAVAIAAGKEHSLLLLMDGSVWSTGRGGTGQLGNGDLEGAKIFTNVVQYSPSYPVSRLVFICLSCRHKLMCRVHLHPYAVDYSDWRYYVGMSAQASSQQTRFSV